MEHEVYHTMNADAAMRMTAGIKSVTATSAIRWTGGFDPCASPTSCMICASTVSFPIFVALTERMPFVLIVPPTTRLPLVFRGGTVPGDHRFVYITLTGHDLAVHRDFAARVLRSQYRRPRDPR